MSDVYLQRCDDYAKVKDVLATIWEQLDASKIVAGKRVLIKVNLTKGGPVEWAVATHPGFARAIGELVREAGGDPYFGDSCSIYGFTRETMDLAGFTQMSKECGIPCHPLDSGQVRKAVLNGKRVKETYFSEYVLDADVIISAPKLKPHDFVELTSAVKNLFGTLPGAIKPYQHFCNYRFRKFLDVVLDVYSFNKPKLAFVDGILAMEGKGPTNGTPKHVGIVAAGEDGVAVDAVLADRIGMGKVQLLEIAQQRGLGVADLDRITVHGPSRDEFYVPIEPATPTKAKIGIFGLIKYGVRYFGVRPWLSPDPKHRAEIERLAKLCPVEAIEVNGLPRVNSRCVKCMTCIESAPKDVSTLKVPKILHGTFHSKAPGYDLSKMR